MKIYRHKYFKKRYKKLSSKLRDKVDVAILKFYENPFDKTLNNHALKRKLFDKRAISVTGDVRIIFEEIDDYVIVLMLDVGTHSQVY